MFPYYLLDVVPCGDGFRITFTPCKQTGPKKTEVFLIPKIPEGSNGVNFHKIFNSYYESINSKLKPKDNSTFWYRGITDGEKSYFVNTPLGINMMRKVPKYMAEVSMI